MFKIKPNSANCLAIHYLKSHGAHNLNRDDLGRPKSMILGGVTRQRISSQCLKNRARKSAWFDGFREWATENGYSTMFRTRRGAEPAMTALLETLAESNLELSDALKAEIIQFCLSKLAGGVSDEFSKTRKTQLVASSREEITVLVKGLIESADLENLPHDDDKAFKKNAKNWCAAAFKEFSKTFKTFQDLNVMTPEISLFGRFMTGDALFKGVDSAIQVAHAFTTHAVQLQTDYWTAQEDLKLSFDDYLLLPEDEEEQEKLKTANMNGGGMLETRRFSTGVYYHYHNINLDQLFDNLRDSHKGATNSEIADVMTQIVGAYVMSCLMENPTGFQTGLASHSLANAVALSLGTGFQMDAASAFEKPVLLDENVSYQSAQQLKSLFEQRREQYGDLIDMPVFAGELFAETQPEGDSIAQAVSQVCDSIYAQYAKE